MRTILVLLFIAICASTSFSQQEKKRVRNGNSEFEEGKFQEAEKEYRKALMEKPGYTKGTFNLGDAMYQQENYEESTKLFSEVVERNTTLNEKAAAYYNLGNTQMKENKFQESIESYKNSLRLKPDEPNTKYNLEYARKKLAEQQQQQQQNQDQNKDKDKEDKDNKDQNKDQENKDNSNEDKKDQDKKEDQKDQDKKDQNKGDQEKDKQQQQQPQQISKQDAQRMLDALQNDEKKTLQKLQKQKAAAVKGTKSDIDW